MLLPTDPDLRGTVPLPDTSSLLILLIDGRNLATPARVLAVGQAIRSHRRGGTRLVCLVRGGPAATFGRGRLWLGRARSSSAASAPAKLAVALLAATLRNLGLRALTLRAGADGLDSDEADLREAAAEMEARRIQKVSAEGVVVIVSGQGAAAPELAVALGGKVLPVDPEPYYPHELRVASRG
jgi:hypothetical protein